MKTQNSKPKNRDRVTIIATSHNRHPIDSKGTITHHAFDLWDFHGEDDYHSLFTPDEFTLHTPVQEAGEDEKV